MTSNKLIDSLRRTSGIRQRVVVADRQHCQSRKKREKEKGGRLLYEKRGSFTRKGGQATLRATAQNWPGKTGPVLESVMRLCAKIEQEKAEITEFVHGLCFLCCLLFKNQSSPTYACYAFYSGENSRATISSTSIVPPSTPIPSSPLDSSKMPSCSAIARSLR